jgi:hypothetical protein
MSVAEDEKIKNIIEMAIDFSKMVRVFKKGSDDKIAKKIGYFLNEAETFQREEDFRKAHNKFCKWFTTNIKTAKRKKDERIIKRSRYASWGHAAKTLDVSLKVCVYYCGLPSPAFSKKIVSWLNCGIDKKILDDLRSNDKKLGERVKATTLEEIKKEDYNMLQDAIKNRIKKEFNNKIISVEYDDIKWRELNR